MEAGNAHIPYSVTLGYRKGADGKIEIDPEQAQIVEQIFRLYLAGSTLEGIKNALERSEIRTPTGKTVWSIGTIRNILGNELGHVGRSAVIVGGAGNGDDSKNGSGQTQAQQHPVRPAEKFFNGSQHSRLLSGE